MGMARAIEVENLQKTYRDGVIVRRSFEALRGITFDVGEKEIFGLLGPNGAGKTTFIKILLGIVRKSGGNAKMFGHPAGSKAGRKLVGYLPENLRMPRHLTGYTALDYYGALSNLTLRQIRERRDELLELVGLTDRAKDGVKTYSKGMLQRLGLAQALLHEPKLLVLDEPTDGLDPLARAQVRAMLTRLKNERGTTIFLNSHILQEVELVCDRVAILDKGQLRYVGSVRDLSRQKTAGDGRPVSGAAPLAPAAAARADVPTAVPIAAPTELVVDLELQGTEVAILEILQPAMRKFEPIGPGEFRVEARLPDQAAVDRCVDALRARGVNIVGLSRRRVSLEDAFLAILAEPAE
jgi:ABC-2 type transport system ATP-binding protein